MHIKRVIIPIAALIIAAIALMVKSENHCDTIENRELRLNEIDRLESASICQELTVDGYIISGYTTSSSQYGLAVFAPVADGNYKYQTNVLRYTDELVFLHTLVHQTEYDLFWANRPDLEYAEITYTLDGGPGNTMTIDAQDNRIISVEAPNESYHVQYLFFDKNGICYE